MHHLQTLPRKVGQDMATLLYKPLHFFHRITLKQSIHFVLFAKSKMLIATNYFKLSSIYHINGMIYRVLSEPCVYISLHYRNVQGACRADDIGPTLVLVYRTPAVHSPATDIVPPEL